MANITYTKLTAEDFTSAPFTAASGERYGISLWREGKGWGWLVERKLTRPGGFVEWVEHTSGLETTFVDATKAAEQAAQ